MRNALIVGGGAIAFYLSQELLENHVRVRIVERDPARCNVLAESLPEAQILNEDGSNRDFLLSEVALQEMDTFNRLHRQDIHGDNFTVDFPVLIGQTLFNNLGPGPGRSA